jgi:hypothetical protein
MSIRWRLLRKGGAALGLFAVLLQLALSFAHIHARDVVAWSPDGRPAAIQAVEHQHRNQGGLPASDDDCPICAAMRLAASGVAPLPSAATGPVDFILIVHRPFATAFIPTRAPHTLFQTRAPPV